MKTPQYAHGISHRFGSEESCAENTFAQASDFAILVQRSKSSRLQAGNFQSYGIRTDIYRSEGGHGKPHSLHVDAENRHRCLEGMWREQKSNGVSCDNTTRCLRKASVF